MKIILVTYIVFRCFFAFNIITGLGSLILTAPALFTAGWHIRASMYQAKYFGGETTGPVELIGIGILLIPLILTVVSIIGFIYSKEIVRFIIGNYAFLKLLELDKTAKTTL